MQIVRGHSFPSGSLEWACDCTVLHRVVAETIVSPHPNSHQLGIMKTSVETIGPSQSRRRQLTVTTHVSTRLPAYSVLGHKSMRTQISTLFHETVNDCFRNALDGMGPTVRDVIYELLAKKGIEQSEISSRFDDVVAVLTDSLGASARVLVYRTMTLLCQEYQLKADFNYQDSLRDRMVLLRDRVVVDHLYPKRVQRNDPIFSRPSNTQLNQNPGVTVSGGK